MRLTVAAVISVMLTLGGSLFAHAGNSKTLTYNGGPILSGPVSVYLIFYGNWENKHQNIMMDFIDNISRTTWFNTLRLYTDSHNNAVTGPLKLSAAMNDNLSHGNSLQGNATHIDIIKAAINTGYLGKGTDHSGIYLILAGKDVDDVGLCTDWCAYNSHSDDFVYAFIGHPDRCNKPDPSKNRCIPYINRQVSPNGDPAFDAIIGNMAHEFQEMLTDPVGNAWRVSDKASETSHDSSGSNSRYDEEISDWCMPPYVSTDEWFPNRAKLENGASWNIQIERYKFLIQSVWNPITNKCTMSSS